MVSMFSKPKTPSTPSELGAISTDLPMMPGAPLSPLPQAPYQPPPQIQSTGFQPAVQRQPHGGGGQLETLLQQLGGFQGR